MAEADDWKIPADFPWPTPQAVGSQTFHPPPIDGSLLLHEMVDYNRLHSPDHPAWSYGPIETENGLIPGDDLTWRQYGEAMHAAAHIVDHAVTSTASSAADSVPERSTITVISNVNKPAFMATTLGMLLAGHLPFLCSPRNSSPAITHLVQVTNSSHIMVDVDNASFLRMATDAAEHVKAATGRTVTLIPTPQFDDLYNVPFVPFVPRLRVGALDAAMILHSSGSTAFPKPIDTSHAMLLEFSRLLWFGDTDLCGKRENAMVIPSFHNYAIVQVLCKAVPSGKINVVYHPQLPERVPVAEQVLKDIVASDSYTLLMVPLLLSEWSRDEKAIAQLANFRAIFTGGAPLSKEAGAALCAGGVRLVNLYGSTECGISSRLLIDNNLGSEWEWIEKVGAMDWYLADQGDGTFELHVMRHKFCHPGVVNFTAPDGRVGFATSDLLAPHPTNPNLWRIIGRKDEQILLSNGEKTNPLPLEGLINKHELVLDSMMFGEGKSQNGVLVMPRPPMAVDTNDPKAVAKFRNAIWSAVEQANAFAPQHSRIFKELILVGNPEKPFDYTPKMSLRRKMVLKIYEQEINDIYTAKDQSAMSIAPPENWLNVASTTAFARRLVSEVLSADKLADDDDIFLHGCDSLQATYIRNTAIKALDASNMDSSKLQTNFVYLNPTIAALGRYLFRLASNALPDVTVQHALMEMENMVQKYTSSFPQHTPSVSSSAGTQPKAVLLTGSTGALGSYLLAALLQDDAISSIYALNRSSTHQSLKERQKSAFVDRGLPVALLNHPKLVLIDGMDLAQPHLGLSSSVYEHIRSNVTTIIHNAWTLNFNNSLAQFEPQIAGVRHLVDLALHSPAEKPPVFLFTSSVGAVSNWSGSDKVPEKPIESLVSAIGMGYGASKAVAEKVLEEASKATALQSIIVRIGQLSGSTVNGAWAKSDWVPIMLTSAPHVQCLPSLPQKVCWIPIDQAAQILLDFSSSSSRLEQLSVLHMTHPKPIQWDTILKVAAEHYSVPLVPYNTWLDAVQVSGPENPAIRLLDFYRRAQPSPSDLQHPDAREATGIPLFDTTLSQAASNTLKTLQPLDASSMRQWQTYWAT